MNKKKIILTSILIILIILTLFFIFSNSLDSTQESREKSLAVREIVEPVVEHIVGKGNVSDHLVRKLAHFTEFFILGVEMTLLCILHKIPVTYSCFAGLLFALTDETIQVFAQRGSQVQDVWLDFCAVVISAAIVFLTACFVRKTRTDVRTKQNKRSGQLHD